MHLLWIHDWEVIRIDRTTGWEPDTDIDERRRETLKKYREKRTVIENQECSVCGKRRTYYRKEIREADARTEWEKGTK